MLGLRTSVKRSYLITGLFGGMHALEERTDTRIFLAPEVVGDYRKREGALVSQYNSKMSIAVDDDRDRVRTGKSDGWSVGRSCRHRAFQSSELRLATGRR